MALKFQYNKVSMQVMQKNLKIRMAALPTLKSKEAYLRITIKKERHLLDAKKQELLRLRTSIDNSQRLFAEFPTNSIAVTDVRYGSDNIAGITIPLLESIDFESAEPIVSDPAWQIWGKNLIIALVQSQAEIHVSERRIDLLEYARKKTTQKVNLYEKVQLPEFSTAILKIKRYLEDVENLEKAAQKITKNRQSAEVA